MARGKQCPCCKHSLFADREDYRDKGTWVYYICRNFKCEKCKGRCRHTEKVFEPSPYSR